MFERVGFWPRDEATDSVKNLQIIVINHTWPINYHIVVFLQKIIVFPGHPCRLSTLARPHGGTVDFESPTTSE